jgi:hypothetical protein
VLLPTLRFGRPPHGAILATAFIVFFTTSLLRRFLTQIVEAGVKVHQPEREAVALGIQVTSSLCAYFNSSRLSHKAKIALIWIVTRPPKNPIRPLNNTFAVEISIIVHLKSIIVSGEAAQQNGTAAAAGQAKLFLNYASFLANRACAERRSRCLPVPCILRASRCWAAFYFDAIYFSHSFYRYNMNFFL